MLDILRKKLYKLKGSVKARPGAPGWTRPETERNHYQKKEELWKEPYRPKELVPRKRQIITLSVIFIIVVAVIAGAVSIYRTWFSFSKDNVVLELSGDSELVSGNEINYRVKIENNNRVALKNIEIIFNYPSSSFEVEGGSSEEDLLKTENFAIEELSPGEKWEQILKARIIGGKGDVKEARLKAIYSPKGVSSRFESTDSFSTSITDVPIIISTTLPNEVLSDEEIEFGIVYSNQGDVDYSDLRIRIQYPEGFKYVSSAPEPTELDNSWRIPELLAYERGQILIKGVISGEIEQVKTFKIIVEIKEKGRYIRYTEEEIGAKIVNRPLSIDLSVNKEDSYTAVLGDKLDFTVDFKNTFNVSFKDAVITVELEGEMFDYSSVFSKGSFDSSRRAITWRASDVPQLALIKPQEKGTASFQIKVKDKYPISSFKDKNFTLKAKAKIITYQVPPFIGIEEISAEDSVEIKIKTDLILDAKGFYNDSASSIDNFGPIPPRVGETTSYTIHWQVINSSNDAEGVVVRSYLPTGVKWTGRVTSNVQGARPEYNELTGEVIWEIGRVPATTGVALPTYEAVFQVSITPSITQISRPVDLINESSITGFDTFVEEKVRNFDAIIDTTLPDDSSIEKNDGEVRS